MSIKIPAADVKTTVAVGSDGGSGSYANGQQGMEKATEGLRHCN